MRKKPAVIQQSQTFTFKETFIPPPIRGWSSTQNPHGGDPKYASIFVNAWASEGSVSVRGGSASFATRGGAGAVYSLYVHRTPSVVETFWAFTNNGIYNITAGGAYGAATNALTNGYWHGVIFTNPAGTAYLWGVNGTDNALHYNGVVWASPTITGIASSSLEYVWIFKRRLFCIEKNSMNAWYLPIDSIAGAATKLPVGGLFSRGGKLLSGFTWTLDGGNGPDDYCGFVTSEGEVAIYQGTDPDSPNTWGLIGVFFVGKPAGARCWARVGSDILLATQFGLVQLSRVVKGELVTPQNLLSKQIWDTWTFEWTRSYNANQYPSAWSVVAFPSQNALLVTLPSVIINGGTFQFVVNLQTNSWSKFSDWSSYHFVVKGNDLYYANVATNGEIVNAWTTATKDLGVDISLSITQCSVKLLGGRSFQVVQVKPDFKYNNNTLVSFCGATVPPASVNRWINPYLAQPYNPSVYLEINLSVTSSVGQTWYGTNVRYIPVPISV